MRHLFLWRPPVLCSAPVGERTHGHATVPNGFTCRSVWGVSQHIPQSLRRGIHNHQGTPCCRPSARRRYQPVALPAAMLYGMNLHLIFVSHTPDPMCISPPSAASSSLHGDHATQVIPIFSLLFLSLHSPHCLPCITTLGKIERRPIQHSQCTMIERLGGVTGRGGVAKAGGGASAPGGVST